MECQDCSENPLWIVSLYKLYETDSLNLDVAVMFKCKTVTPKSENMFDKILHFNEALVIARNY